jgi:hypothetical protein
MNKSLVEINKPSLVNFRSVLLVATIIALLLFLTIPSRLSSADLTSCSDWSSGNYCSYLGLNVSPSVVSSGGPVTITNSFCSSCSTVPSTQGESVVDSTLEWVFVTTPDHQVYQAGGYEGFFAPLYTYSGGGSILLDYGCPSSGSACGAEWYADGPVSSLPSSLSSFSSYCLGTGSSAPPAVAAAKAPPTDSTGDTSIAGTYSIAACWYSSQFGAAFLTDSFNVGSPDFSFSSVSPLTVSVEGLGSATVTANSVYSFSSAITLSATGTGFTTSFSPNPITPSGGGSASSTLTLSVQPFVTPGTYSVTVTGTSTSPSLTHSTTFEVTVSSDPSSMSSVISKLSSAACIANSGIASSLTNKLSSAETQISSGNYNSAENVLFALINEANAQNGRQISSSCVVGGIVFNAASVLVSDATSLINSLKTSSSASEITGSVISTQGAGVSGATVGLCSGSSCTGSSILASATTDSTGFYYFASTSSLIPGTTYTVFVTGFPSGYSSSTSYTFTWSGAAMSIPNLVVS